MKEISNISWLSLSEVLAIHEKLLALYGGSVGVRDLNLLKSTITRPQTFLFYESKSDIFDIASVYADSIINFHPFIDGNKRSGFIVAALFIEINGYIVNANEVEVVKMTLGLADKSISAKEYAKWLRYSSKLFE